MACPAGPAVCLPCLGRGVGAAHQYRGAVSTSR